MLLLVLQRQELRNRRPAGVHCTLDRGAGYQGADARERSIQSLGKSKGAKKVENKDAPGNWNRTCALSCFLKTRYLSGSLLRKQLPLKCHCKFNFLLES